LPDCENELQERRGEYDREKMSMRGFDFKKYPEKTDKLEQFDDFIKSEGRLDGKGDMNSYYDEKKERPSSQERHQGTIRNEQEQNADDISDIESRRKVVYPQAMNIGKRGKPVISQLCRKEKKK
jgi:hypothetical protein